MMESDCKSDVSIISELDVTDVSIISELDVSMMESDWNPILTLILKYKKIE